MVGVGGVAQAEQQRDEQRDERSRRPAPSSAIRSSSPNTVSSSRVRRRDGRLAEGDAAVVRRSRRGTSTRSPAASSRAGVRSSSTRFWNTPPESTTVPSPRSRGDARAGGRGRVREPVVEARARSAAVATPARRRRPPRATVVARVEHEAHVAHGDRQRVRAALGGVAGGLELDRRLALVGDRGAQPAERGDGVEQPPGARRHRRRRAGADAARRPPPSARASTAGERRRQRRLVAPPRRARRTPSATARASPRRRPAGAPARGARRARSRRGRRRAARRPRPCRRVPRPAPSKIAPTAGPVSPCSARHAARCAWWCWTATCSTPSRSSA